MASTSKSACTSSRPLRGQARELVFIVYTHQKATFFEGGLGSTEPPILEEKLRLYSMRFCPNSHRAHLMLAVKQVQHDVVYINLDDKPEWYIDLIPLAKVPAIFDPVQEMYMMEPLTISHYLDERYQPLLYSADHAEKENEKKLVDDFSNVTKLYSKLYLSPTPDIKIFEDILNFLDVYEKELSKRKLRYFGGRSARIVDYMIWPWFERFEMFPIMYGEKFKIPTIRFTALSNWIKAMMTNEAVKSFYLKPEVYIEFLKSRKDGKYTNYDII